MPMEDFQPITQTTDAHPAERNVEIRVMRTSKEMNPDNTEILFEEIDITNPDAQSLLNDYDWLLSNCYEDIKKDKNGVAFVGSGNHAIVLKDPNFRFCMKISWNMLMLNHKFRPHGKIIDLPDRLQGLSRVNTYFNGSDKVEGIKQKRRKFMAKGAEFKTPNDIKVEATITMYVYARFEEIGMPGVTPRVLSVFKYKNEEDGTTPNLQYYAVNEDVEALTLSYIDGITIEQLILDHPEEIAPKMNMDTFIAQLRDMVDNIHSFGVTHGDISIRNVMIDRHTLEPRIIDFGASMYSGNHLNQDELQHDEDGIANIAQLLKSFRTDPQKTEEAMRNRHSKL